MACWNPLGNLGLLEHMSLLLSLHGPIIKLPLLQIPIFLCCLALLRIRHRKLHPLTVTKANLMKRECDDSWSLEFQEVDWASLGLRWSSSLCCACWHSPPALCSLSPALICVSSNLSGSAPIREQNSLTSSLTSRWNPKEWISSPMGPVTTILELSEDLALTLPLPEFLVKVLITLPFPPICWIGSFLQNAVLSTRLVPSFRANLIFSSSFRSLLKCYFISLILEHTL